MGKTITTEDPGGWRCEWRLVARDVEVDVFRDGELVIEWNYPMAPGHRSLAANATFWRDQAILQAKSELRDAAKAWSEAEGQTPDGGVAPSESDLQTMLEKRAEIHRELASIDQQLAEEERLKSLINEHLAVKRRAAVTKAMEDL